MHETLKISVVLLVTVQDLNLIVPGLQAFFFVLHENMPK